MTSHLVQLWFLKYFLERIFPQNKNSIKDIFTSDRWKAILMHNGRSLNHPSNQLQFDWISNWSEFYLGLHQHYQVGRWPSWCNYSGSTYFHHSIPSFLKSKIWHLIGKTGSSLFEHSYYNLQSRLDFERDIVSRNCWFQNWVLKLVLLWDFYNSSWHYPRTFLWRSAWNKILKHWNVPSHLINMIN